MRKSLQAHLQTRRGRTGSQQGITVQGKVVNDRSQIMSSITNSPSIQRQSRHTTDHAQSALQPPQGLDQRLDREISIQNPKAGLWFSKQSQSKYP